MSNGSLLQQVREMVRLDLFIAGVEKSKAAATLENPFVCDTEAFDTAVSNYFPTIREKVEGVLRPVYLIGQLYKQTVKKSNHIVEKVITPKV